MNFLRQYWPGAAMFVIGLVLILVSLNLMKVDSVEYYPDPLGKTNGTLLKNNALIIDTHASREDVEAWKKRAYDIVDAAAETILRQPK